MAKPISRKLAEQALASIKGQFKVWIDEEGEQYDPVLVEEWNDTHWAICWDGGPYAWTTLAVEGGNEIEFGAKVPAAEGFPNGDVFAEPYDNCVLMLYPF